MCHHKNDPNVINFHLALNPNTKSYKNKISFKKNDELITMTIQEKCNFEKGKKKKKQKHNNLT